MSQEFDDFFGLIPQASDEDDTEWLQKDPKNLLLAELYLAEKKARRGGKRGTMDTHRFEINLFENLMRLRNGAYYFRSSTKGDICSAV